MLRTPLLPQLKDPVIARAFAALQNFIESLLALDLLSGELVENVALTAGSTTQVSHGLGRKPRSWVLLDKDADSRVWRSGADARHLLLECTNNVTVSLWVF